MWYNRHWRLSFQWILCEMSELQQFGFCLPSSCFELWRSGLHVRRRRWVGWPLTASFVILQWSNAREKHAQTQDFSSRCPERRLVGCKQTQVMFVIRQGFSWTTIKGHRSLDGLFIYLPLSPSFRPRVPPALVNVVIRPIRCAVGAAGLLTTSRSTLAPNVDIRPLRSVPVSIVDYTF